MKIIALIFCLAIGLQTALGQNLNVPTLSPFSEVSQEVALTKVSLAYSRPSAKGRKVFGELVPFGEIWRTGANASSKLSFTEDVRIAGNNLKAGTYALYTIPGEKSWTIIIHTNIKHRSLAGDVYKQAEDAFRFEAVPFESSGFIETFTIGFTDIGSDYCFLTLGWENTRVKFRIDFDVDRQIETQITGMLKSTDGMSGQNYFLAAEYYFHNDKDLDKAVSWIAAGIEKSPKNARFGLLHAKILSKQGKREEALKTIAEANSWARESNNANYISQTQLFWDSIK